MTDIRRLLVAVEEFGFAVVVKEGVPRLIRKEWTATELPPRLMAALKKHRDAIIRMLSHDDARSETNRP